LKFLTPLRMVETVYRCSCFFQTIYYLQVKWKCRKISYAKKTVHICTVFFVEVQNVKIQNVEIQIVYFIIYE
jgi:hypothetical protein